MLPGALPNTPFPQDGTESFDTMEAMAASDDSVLLAGYTYGSYASTNDAGTRQGVVVMLQATESVSAPSPASTPGPAPSPFTPSQSGSSTSGDSSSLTTIIAAGVAAVAFLALVAGLCYCKRGAITRRFRKKSTERSGVSAIPEPVSRSVHVERGVDRGSPPGAGGGGIATHSALIPLSGQTSTDQEQSRDPDRAAGAQNGGGAGGEASRFDPAPLPPAYASTGDAESAVHPSVLVGGRSFERRADAQAAGDTKVALPSYDEVESGKLGVRRTRDLDGTRRSPEDTTSTLTISSSLATSELSRDFPPISSSDDAAKPAVSTGDGDQRPRLAGNGSKIGTLQAVLESAEQMAHHSTIVGVSEAAKLISVLVRLVVDHGENSGTSNWRVRWCRSILAMLERADKLLGKVRTRLVVWNARTPASYLFQPQCNELGRAVSYRGGNQLSARM